MRTDKSRRGGWLAAGYLLLTLAAVLPLLRDGYVGHGNGFAFLLAMALTFPLSPMLAVLEDRLANVNVFYATGWPYFATLFELGAGALMNAFVIYLSVAFIERRRQHRSQD